jgi:hypothetical protein
MTKATVTLDILHVTAFEKNQSVASKKEADLFWPTGYSLYERLSIKQGRKLRRA